MVKRLIFDPAENSQKNEKKINEKIPSGQKNETQRKKIKRSSNEKKLMKKSRADKKMKLNGKKVAKRSDKPTTKE